MTAVSLTKPRHRIPVTTTWETSRRVRISVLTAANRAITTENVALNKENAQLRGRVAAARKILEERRHTDAYVRRVLRALEGEA